jgi:hypothetical protein
MSSIYTGTPPSFLAGEIASATKLLEITNLMTALTDAWTTWTPTLTNLTLGSGTLVSVYRRLGKTIEYRFQFTYGAGSAVGTGPQFTLPVAPHSSYGAFAALIGMGLIRDASAGTIRDARVFVSAGSTMQINAMDNTGGSASITATAPWTWAAPDVLSVEGRYYIA